MPAFIDQEATRVITLPECYCPGTPHDADTVTIRSQFGYGDVLELASVHTRAGRIDPLAERLKLLELGIKGWSFVNEEGPVPVDTSMILRLSKEVSEVIVNALDESYAGSTEPVPNPSSGPSRPSSQGRSTASPNRAQRRAAARST